jgi:hypothetical protein
MSRRADPLIRHWETQLQANALASRILGTLSKRKSEVQRCALDGLQRENAEFARAASAQFRTEALGHCNDILALMLAIAAGRASELQGDPLGFVKTQAERRARQQFPLAGSLNAYRLAHRGYWEVMRDSVANSESSESERTDCLMMLSEFLLEFFDRISGIMTDAYIAEEQRLIARRSRTHAALIEDLLAGRQPGDLEAQALCERSGIRTGAGIAVAIARCRHSPNGKPFDEAAALANLSEFFEQVLSPFGALIDIRKDEVLAVIAGPVAPSKRVRELFCAASAGMDGSAGIGISLDTSEIPALPQAYQEAERAIEFTEIDRPVMHFSDIDPLEFLVRRPDAAALRLIPDGPAASWMRTAAGPAS